MISIPTSDGVAEALVATAPSGGGPGVLLYPDAFGLRPRIADMMAQIASWGYVVLAPNVFYREGTVAELASSIDPTSPAGREALWGVVGPRVARLTSDLAGPDSDAFVAALQALPGVTEGPIGVVGFCMGARLAVRAAGRHREVAACAGFHGGGLITDAPDSPHLALATASAEFLFGHADNDRSLTPQNSADLGRSLARAGLVARNEIYPGAAHGYTMADTAAWNEAAFERAFTNLRDLFDRTLHR